MISFRQIEITIVDSLQEWLKKKGYDCPVIMANQTAPVPPYPYISYTVINPVIANMKGYCVADDGTRYKPLTQVWSFTVQSDDDVQAVNVALLAYDWFALAGNEYLNDNNIVAQRVGNITNRDTLLTIEYEHRNGFDVTFSLVHATPESDLELGEIASVVTTANNSKAIEIIKEE